MKDKEIRNLQPHAIPVTACMSRASKLLPFEAPESRRQSFKYSQIRGLSFNCDSKNKVSLQSTSLLIKKTLLYKGQLLGVHDLTVLHSSFLPSMNSHGILSNHLSFHSSSSFSGINWSCLINTSSVSQYYRYNPPCPARTLFK